MATVIFDSTGIPQVEARVIIEVLTAWLADEGEPEIVPRSAEVKFKYLDDYLQGFNFHLVDLKTK